MEMADWALRPPGMQLSTKVAEEPPTTVGIDRSRHLHKQRRRLAALFQAGAHPPRYLPSSLELEPVAGLASTARAGTVTPCHARGRGPRAARDRKPSANHFEDYPANGQAAWSE